MHNNSDDLVDQLLILNKEKTSAVDLYCACCRFPMKTLEDTLSFRKVGVCHYCDNQWTNYPGIDWKNPTKWPDKSSEIWQEYIDLRYFYAKPILNFK